MAMTISFEDLYTQFTAPVTEVDCGLMCTPYNPNKAPFCCDLEHAVPIVYKEERKFLLNNSNLWHTWRVAHTEQARADRKSVAAATPRHMRLLACNGAANCQRNFRSICCRQFPFFPYITADNRFIGLTYNWDFEESCWVISHLDRVTDLFRQQAIALYDQLLAEIPEDYDNYYDLAEEMRETFSERHRQIPILHRDGQDYLINPKTVCLTRVDLTTLPKFGPYKS